MTEASLEKTPVEQFVANLADLTQQNDDDVSESYHRRRRGRANVARRRAKYLPRGSAGLLAGAGLMALVTLKASANGSPYVSLGIKVTAALIIGSAVALLAVPALKARAKHLETIAAIKTDRFVARRTRMRYLERANMLNKPMARVRNFFGMHPARPVKAAVPADQLGNQAAPV